MSYRMLARNLRLRTGFGGIWGEKGPQFLKIMALVGRKEGVGLQEPTHIANVDVADFV